MSNSVDGEKEELSWQVVLRHAQHRQRAGGRRNCDFECGPRRELGRTIADFEFDGLKNSMTQENQGTRKEGSRRLAGGRKNCDFEFRIANFEFRELKD